MVEGPPYDGGRADHWWMTFPKLNYDDRRQADNKEEGGGGGESIKV